MNNKVVKTKQSVISWLLMILISIVFVSLVCYIGLNDLISWICLIFFGGGGIILIIGFITFMINQPGITIDFNKKQVILNTMIVFRKPHPLIINFDQISNIQEKDIKLMSEYFVETKNDLINGNKQLKQFYGYFDKENTLVTSAMYTTRKSKKQISEAIKQLKKELNINE